MSDEPTKSAVDWAHALLLLQVVGEASEHNQVYAPLIDSARVELAAMNTVAQKEMDERAKAAAKAKAEADAKEQERLAKEAKDNEPKAIPAAELESGADTRRRL